MKREAQYVICIGNRGYAASLELRKIYQIIPDKVAARLHRYASLMSRAKITYTRTTISFRCNCRRLSSAQCVGPRRSGFGDTPNCSF